MPLMGQPVEQWDSYASLCRTVNCLFVQETKCQQSCILSHLRLLMVHVNAKHHFCDVITSIKLALA